MPRLLLLRHAKSAWDDPGLADIERPLAPRGRRDAAAMAREISERGFMPDRVLCSPARRTRETLAALLPYLPDESRLVMLDDLYMPPQGNYRTAIAAHGGKAETLMVIGHNPATQATAILLSGDAEPGLAGDISAKFPTGALAVIDCEVPEWASLAPASGRLAAFLKPRSLESDPRPEAAE